MALTVPQNAVVSNPVSAAIAAISAGQDPSAVVYGGEALATQEDESESQNSNPLDNIQEGEVDESTDNEEASTNQDTDNSPVITEPASNSNKEMEEVFVKSTDGKRQAVKIDYSNKESIKQAYLKAAGFPLLNNKLSTLSKKYAESEKDRLSLKTDMDKLENIYQKQGVEALINTLGKSDELDKLVDAKIRHREYLASLSPEEKYRLEMKQQAEGAEKRASAVEAKYNKMLEDVEKRNEAALTKTLEAKLHPAFDRYRFAGKLGDSVVEHQLDETVWTQVTRRLEQYPDDTELTQALIDREFRTVSQNLQKVIQVQAEKKVQKTVDKKKANAANAAQLVAKKGVSSTGEREKFVESIKSGNLMDAFRAMSSGKIKL